jgi:hypothetical protein
VPRCGHHDFSVGGPPLIHFLARSSRVLYRSAFSCIAHHKQSAFYYRKKRAEGKGHHQAVIALARRRVDVLWAMLRDGEVYSERPPRAA